jgi:hypothetical protein
VPAGEAGAAIDPTAIRPPAADPMFHRLRHASAALIMAALAAACVGPTEPEAALTVSPTAAQFTRDSLGFVQLTFRVTNAGTSTVYLETCGGVVTAEVQLPERPSLFALSSELALGCFSSFAAGPSALRPGQVIEGRQSGRIPPGDYRLRVLLALKPDRTADRSALSGVISIR